MIKTVAITFIIVAMDVVSGDPPLSTWFHDHDHLFRTIVTVADLECTASLVGAAILLGNLLDSFAGSHFGLAITQTAHAFVSFRRDVLLHILPAITRVLHQDKHGAGASIAGLVLITAIPPQFSLAKPLLASVVLTGLHAEASAVSIGPGTNPGRR